MNANDATHVDLKRYYWKQNSTCDGPLQPNNEGYQTSEIEVQMQHKTGRLGCRFYNLQEWGWGGYKAFQLKVQYNT